MILGHQQSSNSQPVLHVDPPGIVLFRVVVKAVWTKDVQTLRRVLMNPILTFQVLF